MDYAVFNIAVLAEPVETRAQLELRVGLAEEWYRARRTRWSLWLCDEYLSPRAAAEAAGIFARHRLHALTRAPGMVAERLQPLSRFLPRMEYKLVDDAQSRLDFAHLTSVNFDIPFTTSRAIYDRQAAWLGDYTGYVGYLNGRAICTIALVITDDAVGVYSLGTIAEFRQKGYAEALLRQVLQDAQRVSGLERTVLQSTRAGHEMYQKIGYRDVTTFSVYIS